MNTIILIYVLSTVLNFTIFFITLKLYNSLHNQVFDELNFKAFVVLISPILNTIVLFCTIMDLFYVVYKKKKEKEEFEIFRDIHSLKESSLEEDDVATIERTLSIALLLNYSVKYKYGNENTDFLTLSIHINNKETVHLLYIHIKKNTIKNISLSIIKKGETINVNSIYLQSVLRLIELKL